MKIFIDVDNTILEHSHFYSKNTEGRTHSILARNLEPNKKAIKYMYESSITTSGTIIKKLWEEDNIYILTKYPTLEFDEYKQNKLAQILNITVEELISTTDSNGIKKYLNIRLEDNKIEYIKDLFKVDDVSNYILIDDYSQNIIEWEAQGAIGIKFFNEYNSANHPSVGLSISDFKILELIYNKQVLNSLLFQYDNPLVVEMIINNLLEDSKLQQKLSIQGLKDPVIDIADMVYKDSLKRMNLKGEDMHLKYNYLNYIKEYYGLIQEFIPDYWNESFNKYCQKNNFLIFKSPIPIKPRDIFEHSKKDYNYLTIKILGSKKETSSNYNMYITLNEEKYYIDSKLYKEKVQKIFKLLLDGIDGPQ